MYFKDFPKFLYDFKYGNRDIRTSIVTDTTRNVRFRKEVLENITLYDEYDIIDGETPEIIAEKIYGDPEYHWVIMLANNAYDYITDFPLTDLECDKACMLVHNPELSGTWSYSGNVITVTSPLHGILTSPTTTVTLSGAKSTTNPPNGTYTVDNIIDENRFSFDVVLPPTGVANGTLTIKTTGKEYYVHHYENANGFVVNQGTMGATAVLNIDYFKLQNEKKRRIKIMSPDLLTVIIKQYKELL